MLLMKPRTPWTRRASSSLFRALGRGLFPGPGSPSGVTHRGVNRGILPRSKWKRGSHFTPNVGVLIPAQAVQSRGAVMTQAAVEAIETIETIDTSATARTGRERGRTSILVGDDDRDMCELAEAGLEQRGYGVTWRLSPKEALAAIESEDFDVVLVDIHMEGMSGLELCREALAKRPDLVVVVMTGFGSLDHAIGAMRVGAYDFITKPVSIDALALAMGRAARHHAMTK